MAPPPMVAQLVWRFDENRDSYRGQPYGSDVRVEQMTKRFGLQSAFRPHGRPPKKSPEDGS